MEMHALLEEIGALMTKIKSGTASLGELEAFAAATQQLNERAIILKYKAYEAKVFAVSTKQDDLNASLDEHSSATSHVINDEEETEKTEENSVPSHTSPKNTVEPILPSTPISQQDIEEDGLSFDLFSMDEEDDLEELNQAEDEHQATEEIVAEPVIEAQEEFIPDMEEPSLPVNEDPEPAGQVDEPAATTAPEIQEAPKVESIPVSQAPANEHPALRRARTNDGSLQSRLLSVRLETLKNAFGLNERILIVKELFGGDNDLYNATVDELDNLNDVDSARSKVSHLAHQHNWREDSELAIEFIQKVERRYA